MPDPNFNGSKLAILSNKAQRRMYPDYSAEMSRRGKLGGRGKKKKISTGRKKR